MNGNNGKTLIWDNIPEWAIFSLEYGTREELFLHTRNLTPIPLSGKRARPTRSFS